MGNLISSVMENQKKSDWFSELTDKRRNELLKKYNINRSIEDGTLLFQDVYFIYDQEHKNY
jgi:hypothetical protein